MALHPALVVGVLAGSVFVVAGILLWALRPARRGVRAFAIYAFMTGVQLVLVNVGAYGPQPTLMAISWPIHGMTAVALVFAATEYTGRMLRWPLLLFFSAAAIAGALTYVQGGLLVFRDGNLADLGVILWQMPPFLAAGIATILFERARRTSVSPELRTENLLLLLAVVPHLAYSSGISLAVVLLTPDGPTSIWGIGYLVTFGFGAIASLYVSASLARAGGTREKVLAVLIVAAGVTGVVQFLLTKQFIVFGGLLRIAAAATLGYGLLKYGLFDIDFKIKWSIDRGALLGIFGAVFFLVDQAAQFFVSAAFGALAGLVAAVGLLFLLKPLRKATQMLADRVFPHVQDTVEYIEKRKLVVYRSAAEAAAKDGVITDREREMLAALVRELAITSDEVATVEREVLSRASAA